jgi:hypothetical protein
VRLGNLLIRCYRFVIFDAVDFAQRVGSRCLGRDNRLPNGMNRPSFEISAMTVTGACPTASGL